MTYREQTPQKSQKSRPVGEVGLNSLLAGKMQGIFANLNEIRRKVYG
jgi:hypothetical protein